MTGVASQRALPSRGRVVLFVGVSVAAMVPLAAAAWGWFWPDATSYRLAGRIGAFGAAAFGLGVMLLPAPRWSAPRGVWWSIALFASGVLAALIWAFGHRHLGGFDHGALVDLCWRVAAGQRPVSDFPSTLPVGFVLACGYAFRLFGASWSAVVALQACFAAVTLAWSYALLLRISGSPPRSLLLALALQASANLVTSYWWYNPATTTLSALFFLSAAALWREPRSRAVSASYLAALVLLAGMKPNVAGLLVLGISAVLFLSAEHRARVAALSALGLAIFSGWLAAERLYLPDVVRGYLSISARGFSLRQFLQDLSAREKVAALLLLAASLLPWLTRFRSTGGDARGRRLALVAALAGLYGFVTNGELKLVDLPLLLLALWWLGECDARQAPPLAPANDRRLAWWRSYVAGLAACLVLSGVVVGALRHRVEAIGRGAFFEPTVSSRRLQSPFFSRLEASPRLVEVESELAALLSSASPSRPYFGPRMQWAYAAFRYPSPSGQPVWWHPGVTYPASRGVEALFIDWWIAADYDLVVFLKRDKRDVTYLPPEFLAAIAERYEERPGYRSLSVFTRRRLR